MNQGNIIVPESSTGICEFTKWTTKIDLTFLRFGGHGMIGEQGRWKLDDPSLR